MKRRQPPLTYSLWDELNADPDEPTPARIRTHQLSVMWQGLASIETQPEPGTNDWRVCSDAVNLMETLITMGIIEDTSGLLMDAITALAMAGRRAQAGKPIRLDGAGIQAVRAVLEDYASVLEQVPQRTMIHAHRKTERRIREILAGKRQPHDIEVLKL